MTLVKSKAQVQDEAIRKINAPSVFRMKFYRNDRNPLYWDFTFSIAHEDGTITNVRGQAQVFDSGSHYGIDRGRISRLWVVDDDTKDTLLNYDRGWDVSDGMAYKVFSILQKSLEDLPTTDEF